MDSLKPIGRVVITDKNSGKILVDKHNMILKNGRQYLANMFVNNSLSSVIDPSKTTDVSGWELYSMLLTNWKEPPVYTDSSLAENIYESHNPGREIILNDNIVEFDKADSSEYPSLVFTVDFNDAVVPEDGEDISGLGTVCLVLRKATENSGQYTYEYSVFSQICFDYILITDDASINIKYYIYF